MTSTVVKHTALPPLATDQFDVGNTADSLPRLVAAATDCGDLFRIHSPGRKSDTWIVNNPADIRRVLVTNHRNYTKGPGIDRIRILLGDGIMTSEGEAWRRRRRMIQPLFHRRIVEQFGQAIEGSIARSLEAWRAAARGGEAINLSEALRTLTLDIILRAVFGGDLEDLVTPTGSNPFTIVADDPSRDLRFAYKFRSLRRLVAELIARRRVSAESRFDLLGMLVAARDKDSGAPLSDAEILDEVMTLIVAGHETSASALNWTWYLLAQHPAAAARLHAEVDATPLPAPAGLADAERLHYTRAVIEEAMRLYPPGWLLSRRTLGEDQLSGWRVPPGTDVLLSPYLIHRHPQHWPEPERFLPERFLEPTAHPRDRWIYIPFGAGPRHCVGESFALYELTVHVARVARALKLEYLDEGPVELEAAINLRARRDLRMRPTQRH